MPKAQVLIDSVGFKPYADSDKLEEKRQQMYASHGEVVDLSDSEFKRLSAMGAVAEPGSDQAKLSRDEAVAAAHLGPHGSAEVGPPLPGQTAEQIEALVKQRADDDAPAQPNRNEAYPLTSSAENESDEQREAREKSGSDEAVGARGRARRAAAETQPQSE